MLTTGFPVESHDVIVNHYFAQRYLLNISLSPEVSLVKALTCFNHNNRYNEERKLEEFDTHGIYCMQEKQWQTLNNLKKERVWISEEGFRRIVKRKKVFIY